MARAEDASSANTSLEAPFSSGNQIQQLPVLFIHEVQDCKSSYNANCPGKDIELTHAFECLASAPSRVGRCFSVLHGILGILHFLWWPAQPQALPEVSLQSAFPAAWACDAGKAARVAVMTQRAMAQAPWDFLARPLHTKNLACLQNNCSVL